MAAPWDNVQLPRPPNYADYSSPLLGVALGREIGEIPSKFFEGEQAKYRREMQPYTLQKAQFEQQLQPFTLKKAEYEQQTYPYALNKLEREKQLMEPYVGPDGKPVTDVNAVLTEYFKRAGIEGAVQQLPTQMKLQYIDWLRKGGGGGSDPSGAGGGAAAPAAPGPSSSLSVPEATEAKTAGGRTIQSIATEVAGGKDATAAISEVARTYRIHPERGLPDEVANRLQPIIYQAWVKSQNGSPVAQQAAKPAQSSSVFTPAEDTSSANGTRTAMASPASANDAAPTGPPFAPRMTNRDNPMPPPERSAGVAAPQMPAGGPINPPALGAPGPAMGAPGMPPGGPARPGAGPSPAAGPAPPVQMAQAGPPTAVPGGAPAPAAPGPAGGISAGLVPPPQFKGNDLAYAQFLHEKAATIRKQAEVGEVLGFNTKAMLDRANTLDANAARYEDQAAKRGEPTELQRNAAAAGMTVSEYQKAQKDLEVDAKNREITEKQKLAREAGMSTAAYEQMLEQNKLDAQRFTKLQTGIQGKANTGAEMLNTLTSAQSLLDAGAATGWGHDHILQAQQILARIGGDPNGAMNLEAFGKQMAAFINQQTTDLKADASELGGAMRIFAQQVDNMQKASPSPEYTPAGNRYLIEVYRRAINQKIEIADMANEHNGGHLDARFETKLRHYVIDHPMFTPDEIKDPRRVAPPIVDSPADLKRIGWKDGEPFRTRSGEIFTHYDPAKAGK